jgi:erythronate-4-phosphate dehydrogenase
MAVAALARHFGLPIENWYPPQCHPTTPQDIDWQTLNNTIDSYCDLISESAPLKNGESFEQLRNSYNFRKEYF